MSTVLKPLIKRNVNLFFKDKGTFFTSLITPVILLVLYATFLKNVYKESFIDALGEFSVSEDLINGLVGGQLISSILAVSCVTVSFCSNMISVQDKSSGAINDFLITPLKPSCLALGYYFSTLISTLIICFLGMFFCLGYVYIIGWYMSFLDVLLLSLDVILLVCFGTALSSIVNFFLKSQGQISAVGTIVSSGYGFLCGAYMPISQFSPWIQKIISFFPGTYATSLMREHSLNGVVSAMEKDGVPLPMIEELKKVVDCDVYFFDERVNTGIKFAVLFGSVLLLTLIYVFMNIKKQSEKSKK